MRKYYCDNCSIEHSLSCEDTGVAFCPKCQKLNIYQNDGNTLNVLFNKYECIVCKAIFNFSVKFCPNTHKNSYQIIIVDKDYISKNLPNFLITTNDAFGTILTSADVQNHLNTDIIIVYLINDVIIGFISLIIINNIMYINGIVVKKKFQNMGISSKLLSFSLNQTGSKYIALTTQNPLIYKLLSKFCLNLYPSVLSNITNIHYLNKIDEIVKKMDFRLDLCEFGLFLIKNKYSECLYKQIPEIKNSELFKKSLNHYFARSKDALLLFGEIKK